MEAMEKLREGQKFNEVASAYSEDKARQGVRAFICMIFWLRICAYQGWPGLDVKGFDGRAFPRGSIPIAAQHSG